MRRAFRIYPAYLLAVVGGALVYGWRPQSIVGVITMADSPILVAWTLRIEIVFYLLLPVLAVVLGRRAPHARLRLLMVLGIVSLALGTVELAVTLHVPTSPTAWLFAFVPGMVIAELRVRRHPRLASLGAMRWLGVGIALLLVSAVVDLTYPDLPAAAGSALVVAWCLAKERLGASATQVAVAAGALSYGVYLWHVPLIDLLNRPSTWSGAGLAIAATLAIAGSSYALVEDTGIRRGQLIAATLGRGRRRPGIASASPSADR